MAESFLAKLQALMQEECEILEANDPNYILPHILQGGDGYEVPGGPTLTMPVGSNPQSLDPAPPMDVDRLYGVAAGATPVPERFNNLFEGFARDLGAGKRSPCRGRSMRPSSSQPTTPEPLSSWAHHRTNTDPGRWNLTLEGAYRVVPAAPLEVDGPYVPPREENGRCQ